VDLVPAFDFSQSSSGVTGTGFKCLGSWLSMETWYVAVLRPQDPAELNVDPLNPQGIHQEFPLSLLFMVTHRRICGRGLKPNLRPRNPSSSERGQPRVPHRRHGSSFCATIGLGKSFNLQSDPPIWSSSNPWSTPRCAQQSTVREMHSCGRKTVPNHHRNFAESVSTVRRNFMRLFQWPNRMRMNTKKE
jgi:hypothetical protein